MVRAGQQRTAVLALKLAEVHWMRAKINDWPILLLDEVMAELDAHRRGFLLNQINGANQAILTATIRRCSRRSFARRRG